MKMTKPPTDPKDSTKPLEPSPVMFGPPQLIHGEDPADYEELLCRIRATAKPVDVIEEMFAHDVVRLQWDILRWQRLKTRLMDAAAKKALQQFLKGNLDIELYSAEFAKYYTDGLPKDLTDDLKASLTKGFMRKWVVQ